LQQKNSSEQQTAPIDLKQVEGDTASETEVSPVTALKERFALVEEELRRAHARIAELEGK
jgi:uncharacterized small protein (DUF1192 family)